jgi:hypothetical protein
MIRIKTSILILALIVAPVASLCGVESGTSMNCPPLCPMMHGGMDMTHEQTDDMECHHGKSAKPDCLMKSGCGQTLDLGLASPLPPAVLSVVVAIVAPEANGLIHTSNAVPALTGFQSLPFQPPRA